MMCFIYAHLYKYILNDNNRQLRCRLDKVQEKDQVDVGLQHHSLIEVRFASCLINIFMHICVVYT